MDKDRYRLELLRILHAHSERAQETLHQLKLALPDKAVSVQIGIHPSQDPDGIFSVVAHLDGPDIYVMTKAIDGCRVLFEVRFQDGVLVPDVPTFDPFSTACEFEINDVIVDTAAEWLEDLWARFEGLAPGVSVFVFGEDGYGSFSTKCLHS